MAVVLTLPTFSDLRGDLTVLQDEVPFSICRAYWIYGADGSIRGGHRHLKTMQALVCLSGICTVQIVKGNEKATFIMSTPQQCLLIDPEDWHTLQPQKNAVILILASHPYEAADYVLEPLS